MNARERFLSNMAFEPGAPSLKWEFGYWAGTVRRWYREGFTPETFIPQTLGEGESVRAEAMGEKPGGYFYAELHRFFNMDEGFRRIPVNNFIYPSFPEEVLEDHGDWILKRNHWGITLRQRKDRATPEAFIHSPVQTREDWERLKAEKLQPDFGARLPANWQELARGYRERGYPLIIGGGHGFYGSPRYLVGDQRLLTLFYDDPGLILDINDHLCNLWIRLYERVLQDTSADVALIWEDMCYKNGSLISPAMFAKFMLPFYKRLTGFFRDHNIRIVFVDTDGDCWKLIPCFLDGGVTGLYPFEANAGMDVAAVRKAFPRLQMIGGIDKLEVIKGPAAIDAELDRKVAPILSQGGFIPTIDHLVPPEVSWADFSYFRTRLNAAIESNAF